jgi:2-hydroxychromene-2-carboxylate isomerase
MTPSIDVWFSIGSTYTYLTVMRVGALAARAQVEIAWRPFSVRTLMVEQNNIPFRDKPIKAAYMWRDIERRAEGYGFPVKVPAPYPLSQWDLVNQIAVLAAAEGWCAAYAVETYRRWFQGGQEPGHAPQLAQTLAAAGQDPDRVIAAAQTPAAVAAFQAATDEARALGLFGSPSFVTRGELFWGDDRLEDALAWAARGTLAPG